MKHLVIALCLCLSIGLVPVPLLAQKEGQPMTTIRIELRKDMNTGQITDIVRESLGHGRERLRIRIIENANSANLTGTTAALEKLRAKIDTKFGQGAIVSWQPVVQFDSK
jgi:hypothetical protein